jgi:hypothetical protein
MTVSTSTRKQNFAGGQSVLTFTFQGLVDHPEDIKVVETLTATGEQTDLVYNVGYTVAFNSDGIGGTVTVSPSYSTLYTQTVYRETAQVQDSDYDDFNQFPADTVEENLDRLTMIAQEQTEEQARTLRYPISESGASTELPTPEANAFIAWNAAATALVNADIPDPSTLVKATGAEAAAGVEDTHYMTPAKTKTAIDTFANPLTKASQTQAEAAASDAVYMTPLQVKNEVQFPGAVSIPSNNIPGINSLLPTQTGNSGKLLTTNGSVVSWGGLGSWSSSLTENTNYGPTTSDGFVVATLTRAGDVPSLIGKTDSNAAPTTVRQKSVGSAGHSVSVCFPVKRGDYYRVEATGYDTFNMYYISFS